MVRRSTLLVNISDLGYDRENPIAKILVLHIDILKAGSLVAQALEKLKVSTGKNEDGKLMLLRPVIKQADFLFKLKKQFDALMALRPPPPEVELPKSPEQSERDQKGQEEQEHEKESASHGGEDEVVQSTEGKVHGSEVGENAEKDNLDLELSNWALVAVEVAEKAGEDNDKEKEKDKDMDQKKEKENIHDLDAASLEELDPNQQEKLAEVNTERVHQDFYQLDSFQCFHDMLFMQELFTDTVLEQIALHQTKLLDAANAVKRNIAPALPLAEQTWRTEITADSSIKDIVMGAANGMISKLVVKGEPFVTMIGTLHKDLDLWCEGLSLGLVRFAWHKVARLRMQSSGNDVVSIFF